MAGKGNKNAHRKGKESKTLFERIWTLANHRGFVFPSAEIYGGISGLYDLGPLGTKLKNNLVQAWREFFVLKETNPPVYELDGSTILPYEALKASGHLDSFTDPTVSCLKCKKWMRADHLIEDSLGLYVEGMPPEELTRIIRENNLVCPDCGGELSEVTVFNLMLSVKVGPAGGQTAFLRPETAQDIFMDFKRVQQSMRAKLPFGIAQIGKSYRNEISPRQGLMRVREFTQMEIEMFIHPKEIGNHPSFDKVKDIKIRILTREQQEKGETEPVEVTAQESLDKKILPNPYMAYYIAKETIFYQSLGIPYDKFHFRHMMPEETPFYSGGNFDLEVELSIGRKEIVGNAYRTNYDLFNHMKKSGKDLSVSVDGEKVIPEVVEPSFGVERAIYCILEHCYREDDGRGWSWFKFPIKIAPILALVLPLVRREPLMEIAFKTYQTLRENGLDVDYDDRGSIGKRYARADEIGIPFCITIDYDTPKASTVTIRDRDSRKQAVVNKDDLVEIIRKLYTGTIKFDDLVSS
nr:glycine--tRNA ligase [Candidatus Sigynarchaeota archaeon]